MNTLLAFNFGEDYLPNLSDGLLVFLIGVATVFSVLAIILAVLSLFNVLTGKAPKEEKKAHVAAAAPAVMPVAASDDEIVAVIAAAIAAAESECTGAKFRVVSFKRK